jgi:hypothetical protein
VRVNWALGFLLLLHVGGAIIAFGPTFTFPIIGSMSGAEPMHANFALRLNERIEERLVLPLALFQAVTGVGLIWVVGLDVFVHLWLLLAIVLYVAALVIVFTNQLPVTRKLVEATSAPPPAPPAGAPAPSGPPPHIAALIQRVQMGGIATTILLVLIIILMVLGANGFIG